MRTVASTLAFALLLTLLAAFQVYPQSKSPSPDSNGNGHVTGSTGCRSCHEKFYQLWASSFHGLAMRPYTDLFAKTNLTTQTEDIVIGQYRYRAATGPGQGWLRETTDKGASKYRITYVLGGKNVVYFLTPMARGRLQTLPVAYDVRRREWFDMAGSGVRHFPHETPSPVNWKDWPYTFNTGCYGCHVSQLATNYAAQSDTYRTAWTEPGINCETCHGPGQEHARLCLAAPKGQPPKDLKIIRGGQDFTAEQRNALCASCHAKAVPLTSGFTPGDRFFDHFDLVAYESPDYFPDGRDQGENYTFTSWSRSPCVIAGGLDCLHCHTSSGRYKFTDPARANDACLPCHASRVADAAQHSHHPAGSPGSRCVSCHMPTTSFVRMRRSDHSMSPPTPAATLAYQSPNACNICHADKDASWADKLVRDWHARDYQARVLHQAGLIDAARRGDWTRLDEMLEYLGKERPDPLAAASLIRLLQNCPDTRKWDGILLSAASPFPLVRAATADALAAAPSKRAVETLATLAADDFKLVRVRAASSLSGLVPDARIFSAQDERTVGNATREYLQSLSVRPDLWTSQYNLGNYYLQQRDLTRAVACFEAASRLNPSSVPPLVNVSLAYSRQGKTAKAGEALQAALKLDPENAPAHFNMGLFKAGQGDLSEAEKHLRLALKINPDLAAAAYNLGIILAPTSLQEALGFCTQAARLRPDMPNYAYTLAFFLTQAGERQAASQVLERLLQRYPNYQDAARLLGELRKRTP
jgi:tetratricopeptide (TPR) repeat protein